MYWWLRLDLGDVKNPGSTVEEWKMKVVSPMLRPLGNAGIYLNHKLQLLSHNSCAAELAMTLKYCIVFLLLFSVNAERSLPTEFNEEVIGSEKGAIHTVTSTECFNSYFVYQSLALNYTFNKVGQPGKLTRVLSCPEDAVDEKVTQEDLQIMDTLLVPSWTEHPKTGDYYQPYNRPVSLIFWLAERQPTAEWTLIVDPDMFFKQPVYPEDFDLPEGFAASSHYNYLEGVNNELATRHIPEVEPKEDYYGGPQGRRADESGAFMLIRTRDLIKVAPLWLKYTEDVREDPDAWNLTGDSTLEQGEKAWISEMYGYVFAAARAGIRHKVEVTVQYYPKYDVKDIPALVHYGLEHKVKDYVFDKHSHFEFESFKCPPWDMSDNRTDEQDYGLFPHPPFPSELTTYDPRTLYSELLVIDAVNTINKALCERHKLKCPASEVLNKQCGIVDQIEQELEEAYEPLHLPGILCHDDEEHCVYWRRNDECERNWMYMTDNCRASCEKCRPYISPTEAKQRLKPPTEPTEELPEDSEISGEVEVMKEVVEMAKMRCLESALKDLSRDPICQRLITEDLISLEELGFNKLQLVHSVSNKTNTIDFYIHTILWMTMILAVLYSARGINRYRKLKK